VTRQISMTTRKESVAALQVRYRSSGFGDLIKIFDEFVALTGYHRKHAIRLLRAERSGPEATREHKRLYDEAVRQALTVLWEAADRIGGKRLKVLIPMLVHAMERHGHLDLDPVIRGPSSFRSARRASIACWLCAFNNNLTPKGALSNPANGAVSGDNTFVAGLQRTFGAGLNYAFGPATVGFVFTQTKLQDAVGISAGAVGNSTGINFSNNYARFNNYEVNGRYNLTPALSLAGEYTYTDARLDGQKPSFHMFALGTYYELSKRTRVYLLGEYEHATGLGNSGIGANITGVGMSSTPNQVSATVGIQHRF
jgi:hypothetical protein